MIHKRSTSLHIYKSISRAVDFDVASDCETDLCRGTPKNPTQTLVNTFRTFSLCLSTLKYILITCQKLKNAISWHHTFQQELHMLLACKKIIISSCTKSLITKNKAKLFKLV